MIQQRWSSRMCFAWAAIAALIRAAVDVAAWLVRPSAATFYTDDSPLYLALAHSLATTGQFAADGTAELWRLPGFPLAAAPGVWFGHATLWVLVLQIVISTAMSVLVWSAGVALGGHRVGVWAAALVALDPGLIVWSAIVHSDVVFVFLVTVAVGATLSYVAAPRRATLAIAMTATVASAYVRVIGYLLPFVLLGLCVVAVEASRRRQALRDAAVAAVLVGCALGVWHVRNGLQTGYWGFSTQWDRAMFVVFSGTARAADDDSTFKEAREELLHQADRSATASDANAEMRQRGLGALRRSPFRILGTYAIGVGMVIVHPGAGPFLYLFGQMPPNSEVRDSATRLAVTGRIADALSMLWRRGWTAIGLNLGFALFHFAVLVLVGRGVIRLWMSDQRPASIVLVGFVAYVLALSGGPDGDSRRQLPMLPAISLLAAAGIVSRDPHRVPGD